MAMLIDIVYPGGEHVLGTGYPGQILVVREVPPGPECCYLDEIEVDFSTMTPTSTHPLPVLRVVGGPRKPTIHVRVDGTVAEIEAWMDARDAEGWNTNQPPGGGPIVWVVACRDDLDVAALERAGGTVIDPATGSPR